jgi:hypothetical protein
MSVNKQGHSGESLLARWSRRKLEVDRDAADSMPAQEQERAPADNAAAPSDAPLKPLTDADMPDLATLTEESDFSAFMSSGVSDELRNLALRKLFRAPVFNIRDRLDDYDEDYTSFEELGGIVTSDMKHQVEMRRRKLQEALEQEPRQATLDESEAESGELLEAGPDDADDDGRAGTTTGDEVAMNDEIAMNTVKKTEVDDE